MRRELLQPRSEGVWVLYTAIHTINTVIFLLCPYLSKIYCAWSTHNIVQGGSELKKQQENCKLSEFTQCLTGTLLNYWLFLSSEPLVTHVWVCGYMSSGFVDIWVEEKVVRSPSTQRICTVSSPWLASAVSKVCLLKWLKPAGFSPPVNPNLL